MYMYVKSVINRFKTIDTIYIFKLRQYWLFFVLVCVSIFGVNTLRCDLGVLAWWLLWPLILRHQNLYLETGLMTLLGTGGGGLLLETLGWSDGSFSLPQDDIDESADQRQREGHPRQDVGVAEGALPGNPLRTHHRVDDGSAHHKQTCMEAKHSAERCFSLVRSDFSAAQAAQAAQAAVSQNAPLLSVTVRAHPTLAATSYAAHPPNCKMA